MARPKKAPDTQPTDKEELFIAEYLNTLNGTQSYLKVFSKANYTTARTESSKILAKPYIKARIKFLINERNENLNISSYFVIENLIEVLNRCQQTAPVLVWDPVAMQMVQKRDSEGNALFEFDAHGANKALELLGKHVGVFDKDNKQKLPETLNDVRFAQLLEAARAGTKKRKK